jgi:hypothetical protein
VYYALADKIIASGGLPKNLINSDDVNLFLTGDLILSSKEYIFDWASLPIIKFEIPSDNNYSMVLILGPREYIQKDLDGDCNLRLTLDSMLIWPGSDNIATLGLAFFTSFYILLDKDLGRIGFAPNCCNPTLKSTYNYPIVLANMPRSKPVPYIEVNPYKYRANAVSKLWNVYLTAFLLLIT